ncbi:MAG: DNA-processing protein DprA [Ilumatobacteraceae bacterium]
MNSFPEWAYAGALAALPLQTHHRLRRVLSGVSASEAWHNVMTGSPMVVGIPHHVLEVWRSVDSQFVEKIHHSCLASHVSVVTREDVGYPRQLLLDPVAPAVLFMKGISQFPAVRHVAIVGTRHSTQFGKHFAHTLGRELAKHNVCVVSGLARGIDVEAHSGALSATTGAAPVAVVAGGPDVVYPREHKHMWTEMCLHGTILSEYPPGAAPEPYKFPLRNRILAALSEIVVVVESRAAGGSMLTVNEAISRGITVMAVPGSPHVKPSEGTNNLLRDGCSPVTNVEDVLIALGLETQRMGGTNDVRPLLDSFHLGVVDAMKGQPRTADEVALLAGLSLVDCAVALGRLEQQGWVAHSDGWWEALVR